MTRRLAAAAFMLAAAAVLALFARDVWHTARVVRDGDARAAVAPVAPTAWHARTTLPSSFVRSVLGIDDDLAFRRTAARAIDENRRMPTAKTQKRRALVESALARLSRGDSDPTRASAAADYLGVLLYFDPPSPDQAANPYQDPTQTAPSNQQTPEQKAVAQFGVAVRLDPGNDEAARNLEVLLRQPRPPSQQAPPRAGAGERFGSKGAGARQPGHGY